MAYRWSRLSFGNHRFRKQQRELRELRKLFYSYQLSAVITFLATAEKKYDHDSVPYNFDGSSSVYRIAAVALIVGALLSIVSGILMPNSLDLLEEVSSPAYYPAVLLGLFGGFLPVTAAARGFCAAA